MNFGSVEFFHLARREPFLREGWAEESSPPAKKASNAVRMEKISASIGILLCVFIVALHPSSASCMEASELYLTKENIPYPLKYTPQTTNAGYLLRKGMEVFFFTQGREVCLGGLGTGDPSETYQQSGPPDVISFRLKYDGNLYFFLLTLEASAKNAYTLVDASGQPPGQALFGYEAGIFFNPVIESGNNRISFSYDLSDCFLITESYIFTDKRRSKERIVIDRWERFKKVTIYTHDNKKQVHSFENTMPKGKILTKTFLFSDAGEKHITKKYVKKNDMVSLLDVDFARNGGVWFQIRFDKTNATGWIPGESIHFATPD